MNDAVPAAAATGAAVAKTPLQSKTVLFNALMAAIMAFMAYFAQQAQTVPVPVPPAPVVNAEGPMPVFAGEADGATNVNYKTVSVTVPVPTSHLLMMLGGVLILPIGNIVLRSVTKDPMRWYQLV
jgi:hypothetical protein